MKVKQTLSLPHDDLEWFQKEYQDLSLSAIVTLLLHNFRMIHVDTGVTPTKVAKDAAKEVRDQINEGYFEEKEES